MPNARATGGGTARPRAAAGSARLASALALIAFRALRFPVRPALTARRTAGDHA
ncbi:MAG: hypothetical protein IT529_08660 [Burkholderiales bacterium]|nr:hypothetical protein [Burkholderiales bacterium]